jgi:hypothetical protein
MTTHGPISGTSQSVAISVWAINANTQLGKVFFCFPMFLETLISYNNLMYMHINFEDQTLIKRWQACSKLNVMGGLFKDKENKVIVKRRLCLLQEVVHVFKVLEFIVT